MGYSLQTKHNSNASHVDVNLLFEHGLSPSVEQQVRSGEFFVGTVAPKWDGLQLRIARSIYTIGGRALECTCSGVKAHNNDASDCVHK